MKPGSALLILERLRAELVERLADYHRSGRGPYGKVYQELLEARIAALDVAADALTKDVKPGPGDNKK